jgi:glycosyltransferase involved in cell wall biosynthesis
MNLNSDLVELLTFNPVSLELPDSWCGHLHFAYWLVTKLRPTNIVELGTHSGNSYFAMCQAIKTHGISAKSYAVDTWEGDEHAGKYDDSIYQEVNRKNNQHFSDFSRLLRTTFDQAQNYFADGSIELLHIDGMHTYEAVKRDYETWLPKLAKSAIVLFHDTNVREKDFGVWKFWAEISKEHSSCFEFFHSNGLGVLQLGNISTIPKVELFNQSEVVQAHIRSLFASCGAQQIAKLHFRELSSHAGRISVNLHDQNVHIRNIESLLKKNDDEIVNLKKLIISENNKLLDSESTNSELKTQMKAQTSELTNSIRVNRSLVEEAKSQTTASQRLTQQLVETGEKLSAFSLQNSGLLAKLECSAQELREYAKVVEDRDYRLRIMEGRYADVIDSTSWKITKPLRTVGTQLERLRILATLLPIATRKAGGVVNLLVLSKQTFKHGGMHALKQRVKRLRELSVPFEQSPVQILEGNNYQAWVAKYDTITPTLRASYLSHTALLTEQPRISILMPVFNPPIQFLKAAIESVKIQIYKNWELCIADDFSSDPAVRKLLLDEAASDARIKVSFRQSNGHISLASNTALSLATGEFIALLDQDDLLKEDALFWVAKTISETPSLKLIYSDEDKLNEAGLRVAPYFKSDWNPDLILSHNMICHLGVYRTDLVRELGGFKVGLEGAQDYDLTLRVSETLLPKEIGHISRVLYHWRIHSGSTALAGSEKNYALLAGKRAIEEHLERLKANASVELLSIGMYRVKYALPSPEPLVSLVIPTKNAKDLVKQCIDSILDKTTYSNFEIILVDNNSDDKESLSYFDELSINPRIRVIRDERPFNYSMINNSAVKLAKGEYIGLINNDIEVITPDWLGEMISLAAREGVGAVGARLLYPNETLQHGGCILGVGGVAGHSHKHLPRAAHGYFGRAQLIQTMSAVTAAVLVIRKSIFTELNGLDEKNLKVAFNDIDFCLRVRAAGYRNIWTPFAELYHHESATRGFEDTPEKKQRFSNEVLYMQNRWGETLLCDPAYNPNLSLQHEDFSLAWPPRVSALTS